MSERDERRDVGRGRLCMALAFGVVLATLVGSPAHAATPSNDEITNAVAVSGIPYSASADTSEATFAAGDSGCGLATVWYTFTPDTDGNYAFTTVGSDYDTTLAVLDGSPGALNLLACNDDAFGLQSAIMLELTAGTTYFIEAGTCCGEGEIGQVGPGGNLVLNVDVAPPAFNVELALDPTARLGADPSTATVSGTVTCNNDGYVSVSGTLRQRQGLNVARGDFYTETACSSTPTTWTATVDAFSRVFLPKRATLNANTGGCDVFTCDDDSASRTVKLRR
jgi:hypothetical protein